jgi:EAL domain-containing protein (putative c-di-GMP-specific phosphodiesterase class I)
LTRFSDVGNISVVSVRPIDGGEAMNGRNSLIDDLHGAVGRGEIVAYFQPQIDLRQGRIVALEALSRWIHPTVGVVSPTVFIPLAEESGLIHEIGRYMVEESVRCALDCQLRGAPLEVAVNVSASQLAENTFYSDLAELIDTVSLDPAAITVEVTETNPIADREDVARQLDYLRDIGVSISIDDFGTGHSSVEQLVALRANEVKIDQSLVQAGTAVGGSLMAAVVDFAHDKGVRVVAEGIETPEQYEMVRDLNCDRAQGFLIGRPAPRDDRDPVLLASSLPCH